MRWSAARDRGLHTTSTLLSVSCAALVAITACSGDESGPQAVDASPDSFTVASVDGVELSPLAVWGRGRALRALTTSDGSMAIVTTTGVIHTAPGDADAEQLDQLGPGVQIGAVALSPDASMVAVSTVSPPTLRVYDLASSTRIGAHALPPEVIVQSVAFEASTGRIVVDTTMGPLASADGTSAPQPVQGLTPAGLTSRLPDGELVTPVLGTADLAIAGPGGSERRTLPLPPGASVLDSKSSPNGAIVALTIGIGPDALSREDQILILDPVTLEQRTAIAVGRPLDASEWTVTDDTIAIADGSTLATWTLDGAPVSSASPVDSAVADLHPATGGLLSVHFDGSVVRWTGAPLTPTVIRQGGIALEDAEVDSSGSMVTTVDRFGLVSAWSIPDSALLASDDRFAVGETTAIAIAADGSRIGVGSSSGAVAVLDEALTDTWTFQAAETPSRVDAISFDRASGALATGLAERLTDLSFDDTVTVWDPERHVPRFSVLGQRDEIAGCAGFRSRVRFSHDGTKMAVTSHDFSVLVLDATTGDVLHAYPGTVSVLDLAFGPDDSFLVASSEDALVRVWSMDGYAEIASYRGAQGGYFAMATLPGTTTMAAADITGSISVIDVMTGETLRAFSDAAFRTSTLAVSTDGALLAAPVADGGIGVWSTLSGQRLTVASGHTSTVTGLAFSPTGTWLASSSSDGTVRTWSVSRNG